MAIDKRGGKGFCPYCGSRFDGGRDECPNCGQDIRRYNDDLPPFLDKIQTLTNIDMKSPKVRVITSVVIFVVAFVAVLSVLQYMDTDSVPEVDSEPVIEGVVVDVRTNGYLDLTGDFSKGLLNVVPLYEPDLRLKISLKSGLESNYTKVMWVVTTESYNKDNQKNPFYSKVTKESTGSTSIGSVIWSNVDVGKFVVTADCYKEDGTFDIYEGRGVYYGTFNTTYSWDYNGSKESIDYTMSSDEVRVCLDYKLDDRVDLQSRSFMSDMVSDSQSITDLNNALMNAYTANYRYTDDGYADYVLSFVQQCFYYSYDSLNYKTGDYWAYPQETIFYGCGDDEDLAILYCSIMKDAFKTSGNEVALLVLPETTIAALQIDMTDSFIKDPMMVKGIQHTYVVADTSSDLGLGEMRSQYGVSENGKPSFYGTDVHGRCVYVV